MHMQLKEYRRAPNDDIAEIEKKPGAVFPHDYRAFLTKYDGAVPEENIFEEDEYVSLNKFIPLSEMCKAASNVEGLPGDAVPIAEAPSGNIFYLKKGDFSVWFWEHEIEKGDRRLASSFGIFIQKLIPFDSGSVQLQPG